MASLATLASLVSHPPLPHALVLPSQLGRSLELGPSCTFIHKVVIKWADLEPRGLK